MKLTLRITHEFSDWLDTQEALTQKRVRARLERLQNEAHLGDHKHFSGLTELRWEGIRMANKKTSRKPRKSSKENFAHLPVFDPSKGLEDAKDILESLIECLKQNDLESFEDILVAHLRAVSKTRFKSKSGLGRQTLYDLIQGKREFNPSLKTLGGIFKALAA